MLEYNAHHIGMDQLNFATSIFVCLSSFAKLPLPNIFNLVETSAGTAWYFLLCTVHQTITLAIMAFCRRWYIRWRAHYLLIHIIIKSFEYHYLVIGSPEALILRPLEMPNEPSKALTFLLFDPALLTYCVASFMQPTRNFQLLSGYGVAFYVFQSFARCSLEVERVPGQGHRYMAMAGAFEDSISQAFISPTSFPSKLFPVGVAGLSEEGSCIAVNSILYVSCLFIYIYDSAEISEFFSCI